MLGWPSPLILFGPPSTVVRWHPEPVFVSATCWLDRGPLINPFFGVNNYSDLCILLVCESLIRTGYRVRMTIITTISPTNFGQRGPKVRGIIELAEDANPTAVIKKGLGQ